MVHGQGLLLLRNPHRSADLNGLVLSILAGNLYHDRLANGISTLHRVLRHQPISRAGIADCRPHHRIRLQCNCE